MVTRKCKEYGYSLSDFGDFNGRRTKLTLFNPETGNTWHPTIESLLFKGAKDPVKSFKDRTLIIRKKKELILPKLREDFNRKYGYPEKYTLHINIDLDINPKEFYYTCSKCSFDKYVKGGACTGRFYTNMQRIEKGTISCRCNEKFSFTKEQMEIRLNDICEEEKITYKNMEGDYSITKSKTLMKWVCENGHVVTQPISNFIRGARCKQCVVEAGNFNGYFPERSEEKDHLYFYNFSEKYVKVGRAFNLEARIKNKTNGLLCSSGISEDQLDLKCLYTSDHKEVYRTEQNIHQVLRDMGFSYKEETWSTELFQLGCEGVVEDLLNKSSLKKVK